jgi:hypothetical protein
MSQFSDKPGAGLDRGGLRPGRASRVATIFGEGGELAAERLS